MIHLDDSRPCVSALQRLTKRLTGQSLVLALFCLFSIPGRRRFSPISRSEGVPHGDAVMMRQFLVLVGVNAVVLCSLLLSMYVLDFMKFPELREHVTKLLSILGIAAAAGLVI